MEIKKNRCCGGRITMCQNKIRYHKAYYSLDRGDGIEHSVLFVSLSPDEIYERKLTSEQLHAAIATLPDKQAKRIYAHYLTGATNKLFF